jgi:TolA-binding protein
MRSTTLLPTRSMAARWMLAAILVTLVRAGSSSLAQSDARADESDVTVRDYLSGNGLLNRGLYELAATEYRKFLSQHADHEKAAVARYGLAVSLFRLGQFDEAVAELTPLQKLPEFVYAAETWTVAGQCDLARGRNAAAFDAFNVVVERFGKHELADDAAAGAIEALYADKRYEEAVKRCRTFVTQWSDSPLRERVEYFGAVSAMVKADYAEAAERFGQLLQFHPQGPFAEQAGFLLAQCHEQNNSTDKAIEQYRQVLQRKDGRYVPDALAALGTLLYQKGNYAEAGETLDRLMNDFPQSPLLSQARLQRGRVWFEQGRYDRALELFSRLDGAESQVADEAAYWTAKCQLRLGDAAGAAGRLGDAVQKFSASPLLPEMMYDRGVALLRAGDTERAIAALQEFRTRFGDHDLSPDALQLLAVTEHQQRRYDRSQAHCRAFLTKYPAHSQASTVAFLSCENDFLAGQDSEAAMGFRQFLKDRADAPQTTKAKLRLATALCRLQQFDEAEPLLTELAPLAAHDELYHPALLALGDIHFQRGEWKPAEQWFNEYVSAGTDVPSADGALLKLGLSHQRQERMDEAIQAYDRLIDRFPQSPHRLQALFERGQALVALKRIDEAVKAFESVLVEGGESRFAAHALNHLAAIAAQRNELEKAALLYARVAQTSAGADAEAEPLLQQAQTLMAAQQFAEAEKVYVRFVERFPTHPRAGEARARSAIAMAREDRPAEALAAIEQVEHDASIKLEPTLRVSLYYEKAWCLRGLGKLDEAAKAYRQVLAEPTGSLDLHARLEVAEIEFGQKQFDAAAEDLRRLREALTTRSADAPPEVVEQCTYRLAVCEFELERFEESAGLFEEFIHQFPKTSLLASASYYCGDALCKIGRYERAVPYLARVVKDFDADPAYPASLLRLGDCQAALQRWALSEEAFNRYLDRSAEGDLWYQAWFGLGWARENQKRYDEAMAAYQKVVERHQGPTAARAQFQTGQCLFAQGKHEDAVRELLKVDILYAYPEWSAAALYEAARCFEKLGKTTEAKQHFQQVEDKYGQTQWAKMAVQRLTELSASAAVPGR